MRRFKYHELNREGATSITLDDANLFHLFLPKVEASWHALLWRNEVGKKVYF